MIRLDKVRYDPSGMQLIYSSEKVRALNMATFLLVHFQYLTPSVAERFLLHTQFCMLEIWLNFDPWQSWNLYNYDWKQWIKVWIEISVVISCSSVFNLSHFSISVWSTISHPNPMVLEPIHSSAAAESHDANKSQFSPKHLPKMI